MRDEVGQHEKGMRDFHQGLNLTKEQQAQVTALHLSYLKDTKPLREQMFSKRGDLRLLWLESKPDENKILGLRKEIRKIRDEIADKSVTLRISTFNVLTPEQKEKAKALFSARSFGHDHKGGGPMRHGRRFAPSCTCSDLPHGR